MFNFEIENAVGNNFTTPIGAFTLVKFLGKGKSGYAYLGEAEHTSAVIKFIHAEPNPYYSFGDKNKVELEVNAYHQLKRMGIPIPELLHFDLNKKYLIKEYINGQEALQLIAASDVEKAISQLYKIAKVAERSGINLDYFPANFIMRSDKLYYIDYEINPYDPAWDLHHWGIYYWANPDGIRHFLETGEADKINQSAHSGIPIKEPFQQFTSIWRTKYGTEN